MQGYVDIWHVPFLAYVKDTSSNNFSSKLQLLVLLLSAWNTPLQDAGFPIRSRQCCKGVHVQWS